MSKRTILPNELQQMAEHVLYEVKMFRESFRDWQAPQNERWNPTVENALLHFRVLREFFSKKIPDSGDARRADDVVAADYFTVTREGNTDADLASLWKPTKDTIFDETEDDIHKRLAHLTRRRLSPVTWKKAEMECAMEELITSFKNLLREPPQSEWFSELPLRAKPSSGIKVVGDISPGTASVRTF